MMADVYSGGGFVDINSGNNPNLLTGSKWNQVSGDLWFQANVTPVMRLVTKRTGEFPLLEILASVRPTIQGPKWVVYSFSDTPNIDREKIAYFAISVFWRASIHTWEQEDGEKIRIGLGKKYNEEVRRYLLGQKPVPKNASLQVIVCSDLVNRNGFFVPQENQKVRDRSVVFLARGIMFFFRMSKNLTGFQQRLSIVNEPHGWITIRNCADSQVWTLR